MKKAFLIINIIVSCSLFSLEVDKTQWVMEWGEFKTKEISLNNKYLSISIPIFLKDNFPIKFKHTLSTAESETLKKEYLNDLINKEKEKLISKISSRDTLFFNNETDEAKLNKIDKEVKEIESSIKELTDENFRFIEVENELPISNIPLDNSKLDSVMEEYIPIYMTQNSIDYYISGVMEEIAGNIFLEVYLYSKYSKERITVWSGIGTTDEIIESRNTILYELSKIVISENLKEFQLNVMPNDALIYINGSFESIGSYSTYILPGTNIVYSLEKSGFKTLEGHTVVLDNSVLNFRLDEEASRYITISSNPTNSRVYYGSQFMGTTPLQLEINNISTKLTFKKDGYIDRSLVVDGSGEDISVNLVEGILDKEENFINYRDKFYTSSAIFSFSLAIPIYLYTQSDDISDIVKNISVGNAILWGGNLFYSLYQYLKAAELSVD